MTAYAWSTVTTAQGLTFTAGDVLTFDTGGTARDPVVSVGSSTSLTYAGKTLTLPNAVLLANRANFAFIDGSVLVINAAGANPAAQTLTGGNDAYYGDFDTSTGGIDQVSGGAGNDYY